jgi:hypothetical protein
MQCEQSSKLLHHSRQCVVSLIGHLITSTGIDQVVSEREDGQLCQSQQRQQLPQAAAGHLRMQEGVACRRQGFKAHYAATQSNAVCVLLHAADGRAHSTSPEPDSTTCLRCPAKRAEGAAEAVARRFHIECQ